MPAHQYPVTAAAKAIRSLCDGINEYAGAELFCGGVIREREHLLVRLMSCNESRPIVDIEVVPGRWPVEIHFANGVFFTCTDENEIEVNIRQHLRDPMYAEVLRNEITLAKE